MICPLHLFLLWIFLGATVSAQGQQFIFNAPITAGSSANNVIRPSGNVAFPAQTSPPQQPSFIEEVCRDSLPSCVQQAAQGGCVYNPSIMLKYCKLSCDHPTCSNRLNRATPAPLSVSFSRREQTTKRPAPKAAPQPAARSRPVANNRQAPQEQADVPPCTDAHTSCKAWAEFNGCGFETNSWMRSNCKKSCVVDCDGTTPNIPIFVPVTAAPRRQSPRPRPSAQKKTSDEFIVRSQRRLLQQEPGFCPVGCAPDTSARRRPVPPEISLTESTLPCHSVSASAGCCKDNYVQCSSLAQDGKCDDQVNGEWMSEQCRWSCGVCLRKPTLTSAQQTTITEICNSVDCKSQPSLMMADRDRILLNLQQMGYNQFEARHSLHLTLEANRALLRRDKIEQNIEPYDDGTYAGGLLTSDQAKGVMSYLTGTRQEPVFPVTQPKATTDEFLRQRQRQKRQQQGAQPLVPIVELWDEMPVRYVLDQEFSMKQKVAVRAALIEIMRAANSVQSGAQKCVQFVELTSNETNSVANFINFRKDNTTFQEADFPTSYRSRCGISHFGRVKRNAIFLNFECDRLGYADMGGVIQQQVLRSLGVSNQHQRRDRHNYVRILPHTMDTQSYSLYAQNPLPEPSYALPYDYDSIMHPSIRFYRWDATNKIGCGTTLQATLIKNGQITRNDDRNRRLKEHTQSFLSLGDVHALQRLYCVSKECRDRERIECGYWVTNDALLCEHNAQIRRMCPRLCGDLQLGCQV